MEDHQETNSCPEVPPLKRSRGRPRKNAVNSTPEVQVGTDKGQPGSTPGPRPTPPPPPPSLRPLPPSPPSKTQENARPCYSLCCLRAIRDYLALLEEEQPVPKARKRSSRSFALPVVGKEDLFCGCGFRTGSGNRMADHVAIHGCKSAYTNPEEATVKDFPAQVHDRCGPEEPRSPERTGEVGDNPEEDLSMVTEASPPGEVQGTEAGQSPERLLDNIKIGESFNFDDVGDYTLVQLLAPSSKSQPPSSGQQASTADWGEDHFSDSAVVVEEEDHVDHDADEEAEDPSEKLLVPQHPRLEEVKVAEEAKLNLKSMRRKPKPRPKDEKSPEKVKSRDDNSNSDYSEAEGDSSGTGIRVAVSEKKLTGKGDRSVYFKRHYCPYCKKLLYKLSRHILAKHADEEEVSEIVGLGRKSSTEIKKLNVLRNLGSFYHNVDVLTKKRGELLVMRRPHGRAEPNTYLPCIHCYGFFYFLDLHRHSCPAVSRKLTASNLANACKTMLHACVTPADEISAKGQAVLKDLAVDRVGEVVLGDELIVKVVGVLGLNRGDGAHETIQQLARELAMLVLRLNAAESNTPDEEDPSTLRDWLKPDRFDHLVVTARKGYEEKRFFTNVGASLNHCLALIKGEGLRNRDQELCRRASSTMDMMDDQWSDLVGDPRLHKERKWSLPLWERIKVVPAALVGKD